jgi:hypothetical protein
MVATHLLDLRVGMVATHLLAQRKETVVVQECLHKHHQRDLLQ